MLKWFFNRFWYLLSIKIIRNRTAILFFLFLITAFFAYQCKYIRFTQTEANLLPDDHPYTHEYNNFLKKFGEEGTLVVLGIQSDEVFQPKVMQSWNKMMRQFKSKKEIDLVISFHDIQKLKKDTVHQKFDLVPLLGKDELNAEELKFAKDELLNNLPFYESLLVNKKSGVVRNIVSIDKKIVNTKKRKLFIQKQFIPILKQFEKETGIQLRVSGMPYIRTLNAQAIIDEIGLFVGATLLVTSLIFFLFFRSIKTTLVAISVVIIGVVWSFGLLGLLRYEITVLTALVPSLIIIIGVPNCIFLTNKYHQECILHNNRSKALMGILTKVGTSTFITNVTTSVGFATFIFTNNQLFKEFGVVTSLNIMSMFVLCLFVIPIFFSFLPIPNNKHLEHLEKGYLINFRDWIINQVKNHNIRVYIIALTLLILGIIGSYMLKISGSVLEDMPKNKPFFEDIRFFEKEFGGVLPLEIIIDTKKEKGVMKSSTLRRIDELQHEIERLPQLSKSLSVVNLVKYSKQAFYNGNPNFYSLPNNQEQAFILPYLKNSNENKNNPLKNYVDKTGRYARITTYMKEIDAEEMKKVEDKLHDRIHKIFPSKKYKVVITGKALLFQKGTSYLLDNLLQSLLFAVALTGCLIFFLFRSFKMIFVALIPNLLPLLATAGLMGYLQIPIKPSTILVFGIAFGLSVDDTIRFLAQYRQELNRYHWKIKKSVFATLENEGPSMFYTSVVLFSGFSVFVLSDFGGTVALGGLVSITLLFGMLTNLILLPSLVISLNKTIVAEQEEH